MEAIQSTLSRIEHDLETRKREEETRLKENESAKLIQLPLWPEPKRGTPNSVLRGCLFAAIQGRYRKAMQRELIINEENLQIRFTGIQLDQSDLDVWETALHMARVQNLGHKVRFSIHGFLKTMGRNTGKKDHEWLKNSLARLSGCCVDICHEGKGYFGSLLDGCYDENTGTHELEINPKLARLYTAGYTEVIWNDRRKIGRKPLALWLHGYIVSNAKLYPTKISTFHRLSGSGNNNIRDFKQKLTSALNDLKDKQLIRNFRIQEDLVHIDNIPTVSQQKYLHHRP